MLVLHVQFVLISLIIIIVFGQDSFDCRSKETCRDCIQEIDCVWCITPHNQTGDTLPLHCGHKNSDLDWCPKDLIIAPISSKNVLKDEPFSSNNNPIQLKPQRIKVALRKGESIDIHFQYKQAQNYPVDLYYIMDLSASMNSHREKLGQLGVTLANKLKNLTNDVRLGFGSFIDKVALPFASTYPKNLKNPCTNMGSCVPPYSFKNHLNLTNDFKKFNSQVLKAKVSGNLDSPEGGFDAIMQAIVCKDEIGWRPQARHLLIFSTDGEFHIAGDGKLAGVVEPNDAKCHMIENSYTDYLVYDYPSISQINHVAREHNINIIFAIVSERYAYIKRSYQRLSKQIENSKYGELQANDDNSVVNLVVNNYRKISQSVTLTSNATNEVDVKFSSSSCQNPKPNGCSDVHVGQIVNFTATIQPRECSSSSTTKYISIKPEALNESLIVEVEILCECPCSSPSDPTYSPKSSECNKNGDMECGICKCDSGRFGKNCECDSASSISEDVTNCKMDGESEICSGLGECKCGKCICNARSTADEKIYGPFCQCNNYSCKRENGVLCSGKGTCDCGDCKCYAGYIGDACQCPDSNITCVAPGSNSICSGFGRCDCGQCKCNVGDGRSGKYCEECTRCPAQRCEELRHCVECQVYETGIYDKSECALNCTTFSTILIDKFDNENDDGVKKCNVPDKMGCVIIFEYSYDENKDLIVRAQKKKVCTEPPNILAWILAVVGSVLIAGLVMLIVWKVYTTIHDRREYAKFENERKDLKWHRNDNPLYKDATTTFANPVYNRSSISSK